MLIVCLYYFCFVYVVLTEKMQVFQFDFSMSPIMVHNVRTLYALWVVIFWIASSSNYSFYSGISQISLPPCWVLGSRSVFLGLIVVLLLPTQNHKHTHTSTHLIHGWVPLPRARGVGAGQFMWYIMAARSALLHWTLSNTCSPIRGCCVGVAWLCHCTDWHCPVGAAERMKYEIPRNKM